MFPLWNFFINKRQFTILLMVALLAAGVFSLISIPKESAPEVRIPIGIVSTILPGASASDVEQLITNKIEDGVDNLENLDKITSSSREGVSVVSVQFTAQADLDKSIQKLKDAVDATKSQLPEEAGDPNISDVNFSEQPILIISVAGDYSPKELTDLGDTISKDLQTIQGVSRVDVSGVQAREVQVVIDSNKLQQYGLSISSVVGAIAGANVSSPIGSLSIDGIDYALTLNGDITDPAEVQNIALLSPAGYPVYIRDVARVTDGVEKAHSYSRVSEQGAPSSPALTLNVLKSSGGNIVTVADRVKTRLAELQKDGTILGTVTVSYDEGKNVNKDLTELTRTGFETVILVMIVLFLTIGWRESVVAGLSIPLSFLIAFIGLLVSGNTINFVSLFSLILAIGILVDSGIVVTEAIHTRMKLYATKEDAARAALREYAWPLIAGTLTTVAVFVPLFFISGIVGKFIASIPFTIIFVLFASIFVALGLVPMLAILLTAKKGTEQSRIEKLQEHYNDKAREWYRATLGKVLDSRRTQNWFLASLVIGFVVVMSLPAFGIIKAVFFPPDESDFIYLEIEAPEGTALEKTDLVTREVEELLYNDKNIDSFVTTIGAGSSFDQSGPGTGSKLANITVLLVDKKDRTMDSREFSQELRKKVALVPDAQVRVFEPSNGPPSGAPVLVTFAGDNMDALETAVSRAEDILAGIPGTAEITTSTKDSGTAFTLTIDKTKATAAGVSPAQVAQTLRAAVNGTTATKIREGGKDIDVRVVMALDPRYTDPNQTNRATPDALRSLPIATPKGTILLGSILSVAVTRSSATINHEDGDRIQSVSAYVTGNTTALDVTNTFTTKMNEAGIPEGVTMKIGGETEDVQRSFAEMGIAFVGGIILMLAILVLEFNSFRNTFFLLSVIPLSLIGVFLGLFLIREPISFSSLLGIIALAGVIINHSIILMDSVHRIQRERPELSHRDTVIEASTSRLRPIVLTTITTVVGMIPLMSVSGLWSPLATSIMFGLAFSSILTLGLIPVLLFKWPGKVAHR